MAEPDSTQPIPGPLGKSLEKIAIMRSRRKVAPLPAAKGGTLPLFPELESAMPNHLARGALFAPIKPGHRDFCDRKQIASRDDVTLYWTGEQLDMGDNDIFLAALKIAQGRGLEDNLPVDRAAILRMVGRDDSGQSYEWLESGFNRLTSGKLEIYVKPKNQVKPGTKGGKGIKATLHLIDAYMQDLDTGQYWLRVGLEAAKLFADDQFGYIDMEARRKISPRQDLAKWLQNYVCSHKPGRQRPIDVKLLKLWSGSTGRDRDFRERALPKALEQLEALGIITNAKIRADGKAEWTRPMRRQEQDAPPLPALPAPV